MAVTSTQSKPIQPFTAQGRLLRPFYPLPDDKILGLPKLKAFADDKLNVTQNVKYVFHRIENIVGKEENAVTSIFFFSHHVFKRLFPPVRQKSSLCGKGLRNRVLKTLWEREKMLYLIKDHRRLPKKTLIMVK